MNIYRLAPCPAYDIEGTESWLENMATEGLILDSFLSNLAIFHKDSPCFVRYRLDVALKGTSIFSQNGGIPDTEIISLNKSYGWSYITNRGAFHIYASHNKDDRELHTDSPIQATTLDLVRRQERNSLFCVLFWILLYPILAIGGFFPVLTAISLGSFRFLFGILLALWAFLRSLKKVIFLRNLRNRLAQGERPNHHKNWKKHAHLRQLFSLAFPALCLIWGLSFLSLLYKQQPGIPMEQYTQPLPFATLANLCSEGNYNSNDFLNTNTIKTSSDWFAPVSISLRENGTVQLANGNFLQGGLLIHYYEMRSPYLAMELAKEYKNYDKKKNKKYFTELILPTLPTDYAIAYQSPFPTLLLVQGSKIMRLTFYQTSDTYTMPLEEWATIAANYFIYSQQ